MGHVGSGPGPEASRTVDDGRVRIGGRGNSTDAGLWDDPRVWRLYGDSEDNFSPAGAQQSNAEAALVEKAVNSVDAALMGRALANGIDPRSPEAPQSPREGVAVLYEGANSKSVPESMGNMANWTPMQRTEIARDITIALARGPVRSRTSPSPMLAKARRRHHPDTLLSLMRSNKKAIPFVQGKFNMGGTGALRFCGYHNLQLVLSKRHPDISAQRVHRGLGDSVLCDVITRRALLGYPHIAIWHL